MKTDREFQEEFWEELDSSPFVMLALADKDRAHSQPMTAQFDKRFCNDLYFFTQAGNSFVEGIEAGSTDAVISYSSKGHKLFASVHGRLSIDNDKAKIDKFWSPNVAAWYKEGKDDPSIRLMRMDLGRAEIWESSTGQYLKMMGTALISGDAKSEARKHQTETRFAA